MAYTYTEIFIWEPVLRREDVIKLAEIASATWHATRQEQEADTASSRPGETKDDLRDHLKMMAAEGWNIDQYVPTAPRGPRRPGPPVPAGAVGRAPRAQVGSTSQKGAEARSGSRSADR